MKAGTALAGWSTRRRVAAGRGPGVPFLADFCVIDVLGEQGAIEPAAVVHADLEKERILKQCRAAAPPSWEEPSIVVETLREKGPQLIEGAVPLLLNALAGAPEHAALRREFGAASAICVPLYRGKRVYGAMVLGAGCGRPKYEKFDLEVAEELAGRASVAFENARLYAELRELDRRKDEFLATLGHELRNPLAATPAAESPEEVAGGREQWAGKPRDRPISRSAPAGRHVGCLSRGARKIKLELTNVPLSALVSAPSSRRRWCKRHQPMVTSSRSCIYPRRRGSARADPGESVDQCGEVYE